MAMRSINSDPAYCHWDDSGFCVFRVVLPSGDARYCSRSVRDRCRWDRIAIVGGRSGIIIRKSDTGRAGGLPTQGGFAHGVGATSIRVPYFIRLVALALGILGNIIVRGSDEFRVFRAIGGHLDST